MSRPDDRRWDRDKRRLAWIHLGIQITLLLAFLVMANLLAGKFPRRWDLTSQRSYGLSTMAEDLLRNLKYDVEIWINPEAYGRTDDKALPTAYTLTLNMLEEFRRRTDHVKFYEMRDPASFPRGDIFRKHFGTVTPATLFVLATLDGGRTNQKLIDIQDLYIGDAMTGEISAYKGEPVLVQTITELGGNAKRIVYESGGHREIVTGNVRELGNLTNFLRLNEGVEIRPFSLATSKSIPEDCDLFMVMAPQEPFTTDELDELRAYIEQGGRLLVTLWPRAKTGLEKLLEEYSIKVGDNVVFDPEHSYPPYRSNLQVVDFNVHPVNRNMANVQFQMPQCCTVDPIERKDNNWTITPIAMAGTSSWEETDAGGPAGSAGPRGNARVGNLKLIVIVEKKAAHPKDPQHKTARIDVWGSSMPFTNHVLRTPYIFQTTQGQYVVNHFRWLMERQLLEIDPRKVVVKPFDISAPALRQLGFVVVLGFPSLGVVLGLLAWYLRRK